MGTRNHVLKITVVAIGLSACLFFSMFAIFEAQERTVANSLIRAFGRTFGRSDIFRADWEVVALARRLFWP